MKSVKILAMFALVAGAVRAASAAEPSSPWSLSISGGDSVDESGALRRSALTSFGDLGTLDPSLGGASGALRLDRLRYEDLFRRRFDTGLELDYTFDRNLQSYGRFGYDSLGGRTTSIGALNGASFTSPSPVRARFASADNMSLELGSRYLWSTGTSWRPFAGFSLGATYLDAMHARISVPELAMDFGDQRFTRTGTVFSQRLETGVDYSPSADFGLRFSLDADHIGRPPNADDAQLAELGFGPGNDAHSLWSFPISVAARYQF